jgi:hypothetical protein
MDSILHTIESGLKVDKDIYHTCKVHFWQLRIGKYPMGWVIRALIPVHINLYLGLPLEVTYNVIKPPFQRELCFAVPAGQYPPFAVVTETDHSAWIIIAATLCLSCILLFSLINLFIRRTTSVRVGLDEACLASSTVRANS